MEDVDNKMIEFETELLKILPMALAFEHQAVSGKIKERIAAGVDPAEDKALVRRLFALQMNPDYIAASEQAASKIYGDTMPQLKLDDEDPTPTSNIN